MDMDRSYAPVGAVGHTGGGLAPTPASLAGRRIVALDNGKPGAERLLHRLGEALASRTGARFLGVRCKGSAATPCEDPLLEEIVRDAELALTGTAD